MDTLLSWLSLITLHSSVKRYPAQYAADDANANTNATATATARHTVQFAVCNM
jgi:hypothetical protein